MNINTIKILLLAAMLMAAGATEAFAWTKSFSGTRAQVVNACTGPDMVLSNGSTNSTCKNLSNGNIVDCNDAGNCVGAGSGPMPRVIRTAVTDAMGAMLNARATVDPAAFNFKGNSKPVLPEKIVSADGKTGHIGNGNI